MMEEQLIMKVQEHEALYDINNTKYRDQTVRNEAWEEIATELNISASECKDIWSKLRNCYLNALKRRRRSKKDKQSGKKITPWKYEEKMTFLLPFIEGRSTYGSLEEVLMESIKTENTYLNEIQNEVEMMEEESQPDTFTRTPVPKNGPIMVKKKKLLDNYAQEILQVMKQSAEEFEERCAQKQTITLKYDEIEMFYLSMAKVVKRLPPIEQAKIRMDLCKLVSEAEIRHMQSEL